MSMHKQPVSEFVVKGLEAHHLPVHSASQLSDCFKLGVAWALKVELNCINKVKPVNEKALYWVRGGEAGNTLILARFNNYRALGGSMNYWQTLSHDDFSMNDTEWIEIIQPSIE